MGGKERRGGVRMLKAASANVLQQNNFSFSLFFSPPCLFFFLLCFRQYPQPWAERAKKIFKNNHNKTFLPKKRRKRALARLGCLFLWGRGRVDTDADRVGGLLVQCSDLCTQEMEEEVAQKRCFVSAFQAKSLGLQGSLTRRAGEDEICLSAFHLGNRGAVPFYLSQTNSCSLHPALSPSLPPHGPKQPVFPHQAEDKQSQMQAAFGVLFSSETVIPLWPRLTCIICVFCGGRNRATHTLQQL